MTDCLMVVCGKLLHHSCNFSCKVVILLFDAFTDNILDKLNNFSAVSLQILTALLIGIQEVFLINKKPV